MSAATLIVGVPGMAKKMASALPAFTALTASRKVTVPGVGPWGSSPALLTVMGLWPSFSVSLSVALLLARLVSVMPGGAVTVAVLTRSPLTTHQSASTVPVTRKMTALPGPAAMLTVAARLLP